MSKNPNQLLSKISSIYPDIDMRACLGARKYSTFRVNTIKTNIATIEHLLQELHIPYTQEPVIPNSFLIDKTDEYALKGSRLFREGLIYLQSLSSQLPVHALDLHDHLHVLDMCAAPGGKTTQISAHMHNTGSVYAYEKHQIRYDKMLHNIKLQGTTNIRTQKIDTIKALADSDKVFDRILLDAPCSAEGKVNLTDERSYAFWSPAIIQKNVSLQQELISTAWQHLRPGGILVYATCTISPEENESIVQGLLEAHADAQIVPFHVAISESITGLHAHNNISYHPDMRHTLRILPSNRTEGFFIAKFQKI